MPTLKMAGNLSSINHTFTDHLTAHLPAIPATAAPKRSLQTGPVKHAEKMWGPIRKSPIPHQKVMESLCL
jgi:hypothetical protein